MIGKQSLTIEAKDFIKGMSTSPDIGDGGFSDETTGVNLLTKPGLIYAPAQATAITTAPVGTIISSCGPYNSRTEDRYFVDDARNHYTYNGTNLTLQKTATGGTYTDGKTDMVGFISSIYVSTTTHLTKWNGTSTLVENFLAFTNGALGEPHPLIVWENSLWMGDGNLLKKMDGSESTTTALTLETGNVIYALGIDPASGKLLVSTSDSVNNSDVIKTVNKILIYDGFSNLPNRAIIVEDLVTSFYAHSGNIYVAYGRSFGVFTGSGIRWLRDLKNVTYSNTSLVYKNRITAINKNIYIVDGSQVLCFGEIGVGQPKVFHYAYRNVPTATARQISCLTALGNSSGATASKLGIACDDAGSYKLFSFGILDRATAKNHLVYSNRYLFPRPVNIRNIRLVFDGNVPTSGGTLGYLSYVDELGSSTVNDILSNATATPWADMIAVPQDPVNSFKCIVEFATSSNPFGVRSVMVTYDFAE